MCVEAGLPTAGSSGVLEQQSRALPAHNKPSGDDLLGAGEGGRGSSEIRGVDSLRGHSLEQNGKEKKQQASGNVGGWYNKCLHVLLNSPPNVKC